MARSLLANGEFASPEVKGSLDADEDNGVYKVSSAIDDVFDIGESLVIFLKWVSINRSRPLLLLTGGSLLGNSTSKVKNIEGKLVGKDGQPLKPYRRMQFDIPVEEPAPQVTQKYSEAPIKIHAKVLNASKVCLNDDHGESDNGCTKPISFASILKEKITKRTVHLAALTIDEIVQGTHVAIPLVSVEEVSSANALMDSLVMAIPFQNGLGHTMETIDIEYEWQPLVLIRVKSLITMMINILKRLRLMFQIRYRMMGLWRLLKHGKRKQNSKPRHIDGVWLTKPKPNCYYRHVSKPVNVNGEASTSQPKENKEPSAPKPNNKGKDVSNLQEINASNDVESIMDDNDSEKVENVFVEYNGKHIDDLVDDARKKVKAPPKKTHRKTGIWSGMKADSPKKNIVFSPETKVHYFDREDMSFDDMGQATEEVEHENAYSG
ncbi:hypothetical protein Tco_1228244 [Tanacetum coccineum]